MYHREQGPSVSLNHDRSHGSSGNGRAACTFAQPEIQGPPRSYGLRGPEVPKHNRTERFRTSEGLLSEDSAGLAKSKDNLTGFGQQRLRKPEDKACPARTPLAGVGTAPLNLKPGFPGRSKRARRHADLPLAARAYLRPAALQLPPENMRPLENRFFSTERTQLLKPIFPCPQSLGRYHKPKPTKNLDLKMTTLNLHQIKNVNPVLAPFSGNLHASPPQP